MDIYSTTWQVAVEAAGIWPSAVDLGPRNTVYLFTYHRSDGEDRVLTADRETCLFCDVESVERFIRGPHTGVPSDVHIALEVLSALSSQGLEPARFPRTPVEQSGLWIAGGRMLATEGQAQKLLETLSFLNDWHDSLTEVGMTAVWPGELDAAAEILTDAVVTHSVTVPEAAAQLEIRSLEPVLTQEVNRLLRWRR
ncbi:MAG TPA: hypothetical protein VHJ78_03560 [Actinomycetota bacterium]|nr:hypothetical protein [Actinomycetota bacterium]